MNMIRFFTFGVFIATFLGCTKMGMNSFDESIISNSQWMPISYSNNEVVLFAPDRTEYSNDGNVTTIIYAKEIDGTKRRAPAKLDINCNQRLLRTSYLDAKGNWYDGKNWESKPNSPEIQNLCFKIKDVNDEVRFIASVKVSSNPNQYNVFAWEPSKNYSNSINKMDIFRMYSKNTKDRDWMQYFIFLDCRDRTAAFSADSASTDLAFRLVPQDGSVKAYIMNSVCLNKQVASRSPATSTSNQEAARKETGKESAKNQNEASAKSSYKVEPIIRNVQVSFESTPNGATVKDVKTGKSLGVTPFVMHFHLDVTKLKAGRCSDMSALSFEWVSGAKAQTANPHNVCMYANDQFSISMQRPKKPGLQTDIDHQIKLHNLKIQQEVLAAQERQAAAAERQAQAHQAQARAQQEQAVAEANQAKTAQDALLLQMFQGGSMIKKTPSRMPINCSPTVVGGYSCY